MNTATQNLENDHVYILRLIDVMEKITRTTSPNEEHLDSIINLIRNYADGFHHTKEENLLFPLLEKKGFSQHQGPVAVMLHEHDLGRAFVKGMAEGIDDYKKGNITAVQEIYKNMRGYIDLLRNHISKENNILFRMADNVLNEQDQQTLLSEFKKVESSNLCGGLLKDCIAAIENLESAFSPSKVH